MSEGSPQVFGAAAIDRAVGAVLASAAGDALGAPYEFAPPNPAAPCQLEGGGGFGWEPGEWTDDTQMALAVLTVLAAGRRDAEEIGAEMVRWYASGPRDVGGQTRAVLGDALRRERLAITAAESFQQRRPDAAGNGALMRTGPVALAALGNRDAVQRTRSFHRHRYIVTTFRTSATVSALVVISAAARMHSSSLFGLLSPRHPCSPTQPFTSSVCAVASRGASRVGEQTFGPCGAGIGRQRGAAMTDGLIPISSRGGVSADTLMEPVRVRVRTPDGNVAGYFGVGGNDYCAVVPQESATVFQPMLSADGLLYFADADSNKSLNTYGAYWAVDFGVSGGGFSLDGNVLSYGGYRLSMWTDSSGSRWVYANTKSIYTPLTVEFENVMVAHVFVLMLENRSFDNIFGRSDIPGLTVAPDDATNKWGNTTYPVKKGAPPALTGDPGHEFLDTFEHLCGHGQQWTSGQNYPAINNSGYVSNYATTTSEELPIPTSDHFGDVMALFDTPKQLPVIHTLATEYAICDHWFSSMPGPTWPNRFFVHAGTSGDYDTLSKYGPAWSQIKGYSFDNGTIFDAIKKRGLGYALYNDTVGPSDGWLFPQVSGLAGIWATDVGNVANLAKDLQGNYPLRLHLHRAELRRRAAQHLRRRFVPASARRHAQR